MNIDDLISKLENSSIDPDSAVLELAQIVKSAEKTTTDALFEKLKKDQTMHDLLVKEISKRLKP